MNQPYPPQLYPCQEIPMKRTVNAIFAGLVLWALLNLGHTIGGILRRAWRQAAEAIKESEYTTSGEMHRFWTLCGDCERAGGYLLDTHIPWRRRYRFDPILPPGGESFDVVLHLDDDGELVATNLKAMQQRLETFAPVSKPTAPRPPVRLSEIGRD